MTTLTIKDLSAASELDHKEMAAVRGGTNKDMYSSWTPSLKFSQSDFSFDAKQSLDQSQQTLVNNGNNVAFVDNITANVSPHQNGTNNINFGH